MEMRIFKVYVILTIIGTFMQYANASCQITLLKKNTTTKASYLGSTTISPKIQKALSTQCSIQTRVMTTDELIKFETAAFQRKLERLKAKTK